MLNFLLFFKIPFSISYKICVKFSKMQVTDNMIHIFYPILRLDGGAKGLGFDLGVGNDVADSALDGGCAVKRLWRNK